MITLRERTMLRDELHEAIREIPAVDVHSHLSRNHLAAEELGQVLFYHMVEYVLRAAGVEEDLLWPGEGFHGRGRPYEELCRHWETVSATGFGWMLRVILRDLYDFDEPLTARSLPFLREAFEARINQPGWGAEILTRAGICRTLTSKWFVEPLPEGVTDPGLRFTVEVFPSEGFEEYFGWEKRLADLHRKTGIQVTTIRRMQEATDKYFSFADWTGKLAFVIWLSTECDFRPVTDTQVDAILEGHRNGREPTRDDKRLLEAALYRCALRSVREYTDTIQLIYGIQFVTPGPAHLLSKAPRVFVHSLPHLFAEFPELRFNILNGFEPDEAILCSLPVGYRNVSLAGAWWQTAYPSVMHRAWSRRLDMVPPCRLMGFFSDAYCAEWSYGRLRLTQRVLANVLAEKIEQGFYTKRQALDVARKVLFEAPAQMFFPDESF